MTSRQLQNNLVDSLGTERAAFTAAWPGGPGFAERRLGAWFNLLADLSLARHPAEVMAVQGTFLRAAAVDYGLAPAPTVDETTPEEAAEKPDATREDAA